jgi:hypothetical protein
VPGERQDGWALGDLGWLDEVNRELGRMDAASRSQLRHTVGVWDGPDVRLPSDEVGAGGRIGLIDFGHVSWQPLVHVVANRALIAAYDDRERLDRFLAAVQAELPLTAAELDHLDLQRLVNATIYARWSAMRRCETRAAGEPFDGSWLDQLLQILAAELPRVGLRSG